MSLRFVRRLAPRWSLRAYHKALAVLAAWRYRRPSREMVVIGVTGTDGKTTTAMMIAEILRAAGRVVGLSSTVAFSDGRRRWPNTGHMTMPGRFALQRLLRQMIRAGCRHAVIEVSSEGLAQGRLTGIDVDLAVLTNITPEHIKSHGSFERYKAAKLMLFESIGWSFRKRLGPEAVKKISIVNGDDPNAAFFLRAPADAKFVTSLGGQVTLDPNVHLIAAKNIRLEPTGSTFTVNGTSYHLALPGGYNVANALQAIAAAQALGLPPEASQRGLAAVTAIPGRFEVIEAGHGRRVIVDYAVTPAALGNFYRAVRQTGAKRIVAVFGAAGGGRDTWKRPELGKVAAKYCDRIILTTDDPYDEDPQRICQAIRGGVPAEWPGTLTIELDRREAIVLAMREAQSGDVVAVTGMGAETSMVVRGRRVPWNDATVVREEIEKS